MVCRLCSGLGWVGPLMWGGDLLPVQVCPCCRGAGSLHGPRREDAERELERWRELTTDVGGEG